MSADSPKMLQAAADRKIPMHLLPYKPLASIAKVMQLGANKYGEKNWRIDHIKASTYEGAIFRHSFLEWALGSDEDDESGEHPLAHVAATCLIILDAIENGTFIDDRNRKESKLAERECK